MRKRRRQLGPIERSILEDLTAGDLLYGFLLSARSSREMMRRARERANNRYRRKLAIERLLEQGYLQQRGATLKLTTLGKRELGAAIAVTRAQLSKREWDNKWRIVIFDIPKSLSPLRDKIRSVLKRSGFVMLQRSVWVFPHECKELLQIIKTEKALEPHILYGILERIENESRLKQIFGLH